MVASMVVFLNGKPRKSDYKRFKIDDIDGQDDYAAMHQVVTRRFTHLINADAGFADAPDLLLIDGGATHAQTAQNALKDYPYTKLREELSILILRAKYKMAYKSVEEKQVDRYRDTIDEYYAFKNEFPESKYIEEAEEYYRKALKIVNE